MQLHQLQVVAITHQEVCQVDQDNQARTDKTVPMQLHQLQVVAIAHQGAMDRTVHQDRMELTASLARMALALQIHLEGAEMET
ncbi:unnamed protein product [Meloidogyne enterolobii]|uniref:Uncharacterized protein n=1 Tax=Meloidogyne enterolobii TaxID=390850 RepID=A0ACB0XK78_MELEN